VFLSYVREDSSRVDRLDGLLKAAGLRTWRDTADLWPGEDWRLMIRNAITRDALVFLICFSRGGLARAASYQNEELALAVEQMRRRRPDEPWLIPVRFDACDIPDIEIGVGRTLGSIQRADLFAGRFEEGAERLIEAVERILRRDGDLIVGSSEAPDAELTPDRGESAGTEQLSADAQRRRGSMPSRTEEKEDAEALGGRFQRRATTRAEFVSVQSPASGQGRIAETLTSEATDSVCNGQPSASRMLQTPPSPRQRTLERAGLSQPTAVNPPAKRITHRAVLARIPRYTLDGVTDARMSTHPFSTEDNLGLNLTRFRRADCDDVVLLVHGLTSSSDMFIMPEHRNLVSYLLDDGFTDVWALDFRMSNRFPYDTETQRYTLDDIADWDCPAAIEELRNHIGGRRVHVIAHCLGSLSFTMSVFAGRLPGITSLTCNSVALIPRVSSWSRTKLSYGPSVFHRLIGLDLLDPRFTHRPKFTRDRALAKLVSLAHRECRVGACHMLSFMWGSGHPALYEHDNLLPVTHERMADLLGACRTNYYRHIGKMVRAGLAVRYDPGDERHRDLPDDYLAKAAEVTTAILLLTGDRNRVFTDSNIVCHRVLSEVVPGPCELEILPGYGHLDPIVGKDAHLDVFPRISQFLKQHAD
jgi:pimeloyl-ACP methyl ester carboxylesterase